MKKEQLVASIRSEHATLDALVSSLSDEQMLAAELDAGWSVKDVLAHVSAWEWLCVKWIREGRRDEGPFTQESIDAFNDGIYQANRERTLAAVLEDARGSYEAIIATAEAVTDDLDAPPAWAPGRPLGEIIASNSDEHYREHIDQIRGWLKRRA